ncbi:MAG: hypothetical protein HY897_04380 [Deltaproteobacteria bacterium]|nr:hypothetical protein [Deltaproteobacteria bacterium]
MKGLLVVLLLAALVGTALAVSCGEEDEEAVDAGGATSEQTEAYFGLSGTRDYEGEQTVDGNPVSTKFSIEIAEDTASFNRRTIARTWRATLGIPLREWFEAKGDKLYYLRYSYNDAGGKPIDVIFDAPVLYGKNPWTDADAPLATTAGSDAYEYSLIKEEVTVPAGTFEGAYKVVMSEAGRTGSYHWVPDEGVVRFQLNNHPALGTLQIGLAK